MDIEVDEIPHARQRYDTLGDWRILGGVLRVSVSDTGDWRHTILIAVHEIIEAALCQQRSIPEPVVMRFDLEHPELDDPGSDPRAPYHAEHMFAMEIERQLAAQLGVDWSEYEKACEAVCASSS